MPPECRPTADLVAPRVSAVLLLRRDGAALLQHRDDKPGLNHAGLWVPPGGHCENDEAAEECARREFLEETEYRCGALRPLAAFHDTVNDSTLHLTVFWDVYDERQAYVCGEGQALEFVGRARAAELGTPDYLLALWDAALQAAAPDLA